MHVKIFHEPTAYAAMTGVEFGSASQWGESWTSAQFIKLIK